MERMWVGRLRVVRAAVCAGVLATAVLLVAEGAGAADEVVRTNGSVVTGQIVSETEQAVTIDVGRNGAKMLVEIPRKDVAAIQRSLPTTQPATQATAEGDATAGGQAGSTPASQSGGQAAGPGQAPTSQEAGTDDATTYCVVPLQGEIGVEITADLLRKGLQVAKRCNPDVVVLRINSPGGSASELERILAVLREERQIRIVVYVEKAFAAAAAIACACPTIMMAEGSRIGAGGGVQAAVGGTGDGTQDNPAAYHSAVMRTAGQAGGHSELLLRGMAEPDLELCLQDVDGKTVVAEGRDGQILKSKGTILELVAEDAVRLGLARACVRSCEEIGTRMGIDPWREVASPVGAYMRSQGDEARKAVDRSARRTEREAAKEGIAPELKEIAAELGIVRAEGRAAVATREALTQQYNADLARAKKAYDEDCTMAWQIGYIPATRRALEEAKAKYDLEVSLIRKRYQPQAAEIEERINRLNEHERRLEAERKKLLDTVPE